MNHTFFVLRVLFLAWVVVSCGPTITEKAKPTPIEQQPGTKTEAAPVQPVAVAPPPAPVSKAAPVAPPPAAVQVPTPVPTPVATPVPTPTPAPVATPPPPPTPAAPPAPLVAPDLHLDAVSGSILAKPTMLHLSSMPPATVVHFTLDGTDPESGKLWPAAGLLLDRSGTLRVWAASPGGPASMVEGTFTVAELWVQTGGSGDGSWNHPIGTLDEAIAKAASAGIHRVVFFPGTYPVKTELTGNWSLSGGWKAPGVSDAAPTILQGTKQNGSTQKEPAYALRVSAGAKLSLSNLDVRAPGSSFAAAVQVNQDATVEVVHCRLSGGAGLYGYGLRASGATLVSLADSTLSGGDGGSTFALSSEKSAVKALRCTFDGGTGNAVSYGLNITLSKIELASCVVWGGAANSSYGIGLYSSTGSTISASTVLGGKGSSAWAFYLSESDPEIVNCLIGATGKTKSYGVFVNYGKSLPRSLRSNAFFGSATGLLAGIGLEKVSAAPNPAGAFLDSSGAPLTGQKGNLVAEPILGPAPEFRTLASSPVAILQGAEAQPADATADRAQRPREGSAALGAYRVDPK